MSVKKEHKIFVLLFALELVIGFAHSQMNVGISLEKDVLYPGDSINGSVTVFNNYTSQKKIYIDIYAVGREGWYSWDKSPKIIPPNSTKTFSLTLNVPPNAKGGRYYFYVYAIDSLNNIKVGSTKKSLYILERPLLKIDKVSFKLSSISPGSLQKVYTSISNIGELDAKNYVLIIRAPDLSYYHKYTLSISKGNKDIIVSDINVSQTQQPGAYEVIAELYDDRGIKIDEKRASFNIKPIHKVEEKESSKSNIFYKEIHVTLHNKGNTPTTYYYTLDTRGFLWIYDFKPLSPSKINSTYVVICNLNVNESCSFTITINYWIIYVIISIILAVIILLFVSFTSPKIIKEYYIKGHRYKVNLKVTSHKMKELKDVIVKDKIKGIFLIDEDSILPKPSKIIKTKDGHIIEWKIGTLKPNETRIFTYELIPKVSVIGDIKLDNVIVEGRDKKNKKYVFSS